MKKIAAVMFALTVLGAGWTHAENSGVKVDMTGSALFIIPGESDAWENGLGVEGWLRLWFNDNLGVGAVGAIERWGVKSFLGINKTVDNPAIFPLPLGGSALLRLPLNRDLNLVFDGGLRIVPVGSDIEVRYLGYSEQVEFDPGAIGVVGGNLEGTIARSIFLFAGVSYQFDLKKPDIRVQDQKLGEISLKSTTLRAGLGVRF